MEFKPTFVINGNHVESMHLEGQRVVSYNALVIDRHRESLIKLLDEGRKLDAANVVKGWVKTRGILTDSARRLQNLFGQDDKQIRQSLISVIDDIGVMEASSDRIEDFVLESETVLRARVERVGPEFLKIALRECSDPTWMIAQVLGWANLMEHSDSELIDQRINYVTGTAERLYQFRNMRILIANCGLGHPELMPVDKSCDTCEKAQAWLAGDTVLNLLLPRFWSQGRT